MTLNFFLSPSIDTIQSDFSFKQLKAVISVYLISLAFVVVYYAIIKFIDADLFASIFSLEKPVFSSENSIHPFYIVIIAPILEEIQFRLPIDFKRIPICLSLSFFILDILYPFFNLNLFYKNIEWIPLLKYAMYYGLIFSSLFLTSKLIVQNSTKSIPTYIPFYLFNILFAFMHLGNFVPLHLDLTLVYFLRLINYFVDGCLLGYLRCRYGLWSSILVHILINFF
jgi:hypothetical protein